MKIIPLLDKVVVKEIKESKTQTESGILLPTSSQEKPVLSQVVAVGPGGNVDGAEVKMEVKVGDKVILNKYAGTEVKLGADKYTVVRQSDILAVVED